ncbi:HD domain-containing protein, partial [Candidatus Dojkabacteria bacterium]|nr:HD domain-containing protein [Candidatus Dojkabacteria bacterium]
WEDLMKRINEMENKYLKDLLNNIFSDEDVVAKYRSAPGGEYVHHGFVGGLLEHVWEMIDFAAPYQKYYPEADYDLVTAGIILHDIGKIIEINQVGTVFEFSTEGALLGHMQLGLELADKNRPKDMPRKLWTHLAHIIISHNGMFAEQKPVTIEAAIVSVVDFGSSRVRQYQQQMKDGLEKPDEISQYSKFIESRVYIGDRVWE